MFTQWCSSRPRRFLSLLATAALTLHITVEAQAGEDSRVVVVRPTPGGTQVPLQPNERVAGATAVNLPGRGPVAVVRIAQMPPKPSFNVITPGGVSHPFNATQSLSPGVTVEWSAQALPGGGVRAVGVIKRNGARIGEVSNRYPAGSQLVPDPPQPPGTYIDFPDGIPLPAELEAEVLTAAGVADLPGPQAYYVASGNVMFVSPGTPATTVHYQGGAAKGDLNCDGFITVGDIGGFVLALTNPDGYSAAYPECDQRAADINRDDLVSVGDIGGMVALLTLP